MPVRLQVERETRTLTITAEGAIPSEYVADGNADAVVPWLPLLESAGAPRISGSSDSLLTMHALSEDQRLVALAGEGAQSPGVLFPNARVVTIDLDMSRPLLEPALAWEGLDGVMLSPAAANQLSPHQVELLESAGVTLAVRAAAPPDGRWPWKRQGDFWVLRHEPAGPRQVVEPLGYTPTYSWPRGWPPGFRRQLLLASLVFILLAVAVSMWRRRATVIAMVAFCAASAGLLAWWYSRQSPMLDLAGGVMSSGGSLAQIDLWHWRSPLRPADGKFAVGGLTYPILPDAKHATVAGLHLVCRPDGTPAAFEFHLDSQQSIAFLTRLVRTDVPRPALAPATEPLKTFADELYLRPGEIIRGQFRATDPQSGQTVPLIWITPRNQQ